MKVQPELNQILIQSEDYRHFLIEAFKLLKTSRRSFSLSLLAKKIGCSSKSYPREVMTGRRTLTLAYAPRFAEAFGLKGDARKLFLKYVELTRASDDLKSSSSLATEIKKLRVRLQNRFEHREIKPAVVFLETSWIDVYAALGSTEKGASLAEIGSRTGSDRDELTKILDSMAEKSLVRKSAGRFLPETLHHFFEGVDQDQLFQKRFIEILYRVQKKAQSNEVKRREALLYCSTISVVAADLPRFKEELRSLVNRFVQDAESAEGDSLAHFLVGMI